MDRDATLISATDAARNFSDLLNRVRYRGERFEVSRGGEVVARVEPPLRKRTTVAALRALLKALPPLTPEEAAAWTEEWRANRKSAPLPPSSWE
jgi:prevent-host-death family protein